MHLSNELHHRLTEIATVKPWMASANLKTLLNELEVVNTEDMAKNVSEGKNRRLKGKQRTPSQNNSIHLWLEWVAQELDKHGHTLQNVIEKIQKAEIRPNKDNLKEVLWKPYQVAALNKESSTQLTKHEVDIVYEGLNKFLGENFEIHIPFPSDDGKNEMLVKTQKDNLPEYPEYTGPATI